MTETDKLFFELIRVAIGNQVCLSHTPSADERSELYEMAKKQSLVGVCFAGVQRLQKHEQTPPEMLYLQWMGMAAKIQQRNEVVTRQCVELAESLKARGYRHCILKGQGVASLYKIKAESRELRDDSLELRDLSALRQSGDIDVWIDADAETTIKFVMRVAPTKNIERKHIAMNVFEGTEVEVHWVPSELDNPFADKRLKAWYRAVADEQFGHVSDLGFCTPTAEFNVVYLLLHLYEHFLYEGVGLRQMMDYYFVLRAANEEGFKVSGGQEFQELLRSFGMMNFAQGVMWIMKEVFKLEESCLLCEADERTGRMLLDEIMAGGNFGQHGKGSGRGGESMMSWALRRARRTLRHWQYDPIGTICRPFIRLKLYYWTSGILQEI